MSKSITAAALAVMVINLIVKVLGFVREMVIARVFGATGFADAYVAAYQLPYFLQSVLGAALVTVTVPLLTKYLADDNKLESFKVTNYFINFTIVIMAVFCVIGICLAPVLVKLMTPGFGAEQAGYTMDMMRIMFPTALLMSVGMVLTGVLNAFRRFALAAFAPGLCSIIIISFLLIYGNHYGIYGLAIATLVGFGAYLILLVPASYRIGYRYKPQFSFQHRDVQGALAMLIPIVIGTSVNQIYYMVNRFFASGIDDGGIMAMNVASKMMNFPLSVFVAAIAVAIYPSLTEYALKDDSKRLNESLKKGIGVTMLMTIPAAIGLMVLNVPIIELLFEGGNFTHENTLLSASVLIWYALGLFSLAVVMVLLRVYYAFRDVRTPIYAAIIAVAANILISVVTVRWMEYNGLALANSLAATINMFFFFFMLRKYMPELRLRPYVKPFCKILLSSLIMGAVVLGLQAALDGLGLTSPLLIVIVGFCIGVAVYIFCAYLLKVEELKEVTAIIKGKLGKR